MYIHNVQFAGNLVKQAGLHYTPQGTPVANASLGVTRATRSIMRRKTIKATGSTPLSVSLPAPPLLSCLLSKKFPADLHDDPLGVSRLH